MKGFWISVVLALLCGCATRQPPPAAGTAAGPIDQAAAKSIAERVVREREHWRRVVADARGAEQGWKVFVARRPYNPHDAMVNVLLDQRGQVLEYDKFRSYE